MKFFSTKKLSISLAFILLVLTGCLKNDIKVDNTPRTFAMLAHMALYSPRAVMYFDDNTQASNVINVMGISAAYSALQPGSYKISFKKEASDSLIASTAGTVLFDSSKFYTIFTYSNYDSTTRLSVTNDDFSAITNTNCLIRFFQLSPEMQSVDVYINDVKAWSERSLADHEIFSAYRKFDVFSPRQADIKITVADEPENVLATLNNQTFNAQGAYTIWFSGNSSNLPTEKYTIKVQPALVGGF